MSEVHPRHVDSQLIEEQIHADPMQQFQIWFRQAQVQGVTQPEAMNLTTCTTDGKPSARVVLLRGYDERGLVFYTNYHSRKSLEIQDNPYVALTFYWEPLQRQVRIEGTAARLTAEESDAYFASRPRGSCIGAWASPQSHVLANRVELEQRERQILARFGETGPVPRPPFWGGYRVKPLQMEFWQGRLNRLHDRLRYRVENEDWIVERLAP